MKVELVEPKSTSLDDLQEFLSTCASVVRDKEPKSAVKLWARLLVESEGNKASRLFEYIPCKLPYLPTTYNQSFGFTDGTNYYTNMRELLNWGVDINGILPLVDFSNYVVFKCEAPYFIYGQLSTHNQLTTVSHSQRYGVCKRGYWKPSEVKLNQLDWDSVVDSTSPKELKRLLKESGIKRKEVWDRGADLLQNRVFTIGGYTSNDNAFPHFFRQRADKHTQLETSEFVSEMVKLL